MWDFLKEMLFMNIRLYLRDNEKSSHDSREFHPLSVPTFNQELLWKNKWVSHISSEGPCEQISSAEDSPKSPQFISDQSFTDKSVCKNKLVRSVWGSKPGSRIKNRSRWNLSDYKYWSLHSKITSDKMPTKLLQCLYNSHFEIVDYKYNVGVNLTFL